MAAVLIRSAVRCGRRRGDGDAAGSGRLADIHPTAIVDPAATIGVDVRIGPYVVIDGPVTIGDRTRVIAQAHLTGWTTIGVGCVIHPFAVIGGEPQDHAYDGSRTYCHIGDRTVIREGVTVHRGTKVESETRVGCDCLLMVNAHVAHNCVVGDHVTLTNDVLLAGHVHVGHHAMLGGAALVHQFACIGEYAMVGGAAEVVQNVAPFTMVTQRSRCVGLNRVGLRRNGISRPDIDELKLLVREVLRAPVGLVDAARRMESRVETPSGKRFIEFILAAGARGVCTPVRTLCKPARLGASGDGG